MPTTSAGVARRMISRRGQSATLVQTTGTRDDTSDWDDETLTETSYDVTVLLMRPRAATRMDIGPAETDEVQVDRYAFLRSDITPTPVGGEAAYPSTLTVAGTEYTVMQVHETSGLYRLELTE